jgi:hypothetical protein
MTDDPAPLSPRAQRLAEVIAERPRRRVPLADLLVLFDATDPASRGSSARRRLLAETLAELVEAGVITASQTVEHLPRPALPTFVTRQVAAARTTPAPAPLWHPQLSWAAGLRRTPAQTELLDAVNRWLFDPEHRSAAPAPLRERALEITGDEKAFDTGSLIGPGRITPEVVRAYRVVLPLHTVRLGPGRTLLVVENSDTFDSLRRALAPDPGPIGVIGWGAGGAFEASVLSVRDLIDDADPPVDEIRYFGDLDAAGLRIPASASRLAEQEGLPAVRPATGLYRELLAVGRPGPSRAPAASRLPDLLEWLDEELRAPVRRLLADGNRMAQEGLTLSHLTARNPRGADLIG